MAFLVNVTLLIDVKTELDAYDAVNEMLREKQQSFDTTSRLVDYFSSEPTGVEVDLAGYQESDIVGLLPEIDANRTITIPLNVLDDERVVVDTTACYLTTAQISDIVDHAAQLVIDGKRHHQFSDVFGELKEALVSAGVVAADAEPVIDYSDGVHLASDAEDYADVDVYVVDDPSIGSEWLFQVSLDKDSDLIIEAGPRFSENGEAAFEDAASSTPPEHVLAVFKQKRVHAVEILDRIRSGEKVSLG